MIIDQNGSRLPTVTDTHIKGFFGDYRFLSNYHKCSVSIDGFVFSSSESAYMACKTNDIDVKLVFASHDNPVYSKKLGQRIELRPDWGRIKRKEMYRVVKAKFSQNKDLADLLLSTGSKYLEETNNWGDRYWGVCDGKGDNNLGIILMIVRVEISNGRTLTELFE